MVEKERNGDIEKKKLDGITDDLLHRLGSVVVEKKERREKGLITPPNSLIQFL